MSKNIKVVSYNPDWPKRYEIEAAKIKQALGDNCLAVHHIGSTSVPELAAKPIIDIVPVVRDIAAVDLATNNMAQCGYEAKGEYGMLFRRYFQKEGFNVHVFEKDNPEIEGHLKFRDWMRTHPDDREAYAELKKSLASQHPDDILKYCFGKDLFVNNIHSKTQFKGHRIVKALTPREWSAARHLAQHDFFDKVPSADPDIETFNHSGHEHLMLYQGTEIIGYAHIVLWPAHRAAIRLIVIDETKRHQGIGSQFLASIEKWLKMQGVRSLHALSSAETLKFYQHNGYVDMPFNAPEDYKNDARDLALGKIF